ncbi:MAG TPA: alpha/beta fold hydrolase [Gemmatimonadetes bacterium]|nr:alpha/beta fold hydrolase [Gemmatimonadota bacterium]
MPLQSETIATPDEDFLILDWMPETSPESPLVIVLHGLEGHTRRRYVTQAFTSLRANGLRAVGLNFRGCSGSPNLIARSYHSGETKDLQFILTLLGKRFPDRPIMGLGFSLGGNVLLKFLGETGKQFLTAAAVISVPYDLSAGVDSLEKDVMARIYTRYFLKSLMEKIRTKQKMLNSVIKLDALPEDVTLRSFDELVTAPLHGFEDAADYYDKSSSSQFISSIKVPTLLIHSKDDPFFPPSQVPEEAINRNSYLTLLLTELGGHVGFIEGWHPGNFTFWAEEQVSEYLRDCFDSGEV